MHITTYLAALLTFIPAAVYAQDDRTCSQYMISFQVPCDVKAKRCEAGAKNLTDQAKADFADAKTKFERWARIPQIGGSCAGYCDPPHTAKPKYPKHQHLVGTTWFMDCFAARLQTNPKTVMEPASENLFIPFIARKCDVWCTIEADRNCEFRYGHC
ncbi:hypothetical protein FKW77_001733 [Venturia effusa]|uniref:Uncharacterized protein n=1 Tax=Venturia effusa TaxID=50376 RepID=A0A517LQN6_9PEZI|nr:hypothetical protein FKW77_001733 [Venturia effusa]